MGATGGTLCSVPLTPPGEAIELGRQCQPGLFERLLREDPQWLGYVSRVHCRLRLLLPRAANDESLSVMVENLSANPIFIGGSVLAKGQSSRLVEGAKLEYAAKSQGAKQIQFLKFQ